MAEGIAISSALHDLSQHWKAKAGVTNPEDLRHALECCDHELTHHEELWNEIDRLAAEYGEDCQGPFLMREDEQGPFLVREDEE